MSVSVATISVDAVMRDQGLKSGLAGVNTQLNSTASSAANANRAILGMAGVMGGLAVSSIRFQSQFEDAWIGVVKTLNASESELATLQDQLINMSRTGVTAAIENSAVKLAQLGEVAGQMGIAAQDVDEFVAVMAKLEMTTNIVGQEGALQLARFMNIMKTAPQDVGTLGSSLVNLGNNMAATEGEILKMASRLAAAGDLANFTEEEVLGLAGAMAALDLRAEAGGTAMQRVLKMIVTAVATGTDELDLFANAAGMSADAFAEQWRGEPIDALQAFIEGMGRMDEATRLSTLEDLGLDAVRVSDMLLRLSGNFDLVAESIGYANDQSANFLDREAELRMDTFTGQTNRLKNNIKALALEMGGLSSATNGMSAAGDIAEWLNIFVDPGSITVEPPEVILPDVEDYQQFLEIPVETTYTVEAGDTISALSAELGIPEEDLLAQLEADGYTAYNIPIGYEFTIQEGVDAGFRTAVSNAMTVLLQHHDEELSEFEDQVRTRTEIAAITLTETLNEMGIEIGPETSLKIVQSISDGFDDATKDVSINKSEILLGAMLPHLLLDDAYQIGVNIANAALDGANDLLGGGGDDNGTGSNETIMPLNEDIPFLGSFEFPAAEMLVTPTLSETWAEDMLAAITEAKLNTLAINFEPNQESLDALMADLYSSFGNEHGEDDEDGGGGMTIPLVIDPLFHEELAAVKDAEQEIITTATSPLMFNLNDPEIATRLKAEVEDIPTDVTINVTLDVSVTGDPIPGGIGLPGRAGGGPVKKGQPYIVGEEGEEVFVPDQPGYIVSNDDLNRGGGRAMAGGGGGGNISVHVYGDVYDERTMDDLIGRLERARTSLRI